MEWGTCLLEDHVFNLVTKSRYWQKPTYKSMSDALVAMRDICVEQDINRITSLFSIKQLQKRGIIGYYGGPIPYTANHLIVTDDLWR